MEGDKTTMAKETRTSNTSSPPYTPSHVANFFLDCAAEEGGDLTMLKLQKLVYFAYGWTLAVLGQELFNTTEHPIRRYRYGPVIESLYWEFKFLGNKPIENYSRSLKNDGEFGVEKIPVQDKAYRILQQVWKAYGGLTKHKLIALTHEAGSPWDKANKRGSSALKTEEIEKHFGGLLHPKLPKVS